jgi:hypothetical protein
MKMKRATSMGGAAQLLAAESYLRLRRSVYFGAWRTRLAGGYPDVREPDVFEMTRLLARAGAEPVVAPATAPPISSERAAKATEVESESQPAPEAPPAT